MGVWFEDQKQGTDTTSCDGRRKKGRRQNQVVKEVSNLAKRVLQFLTESKRLQTEQCTKHMDPQLDTIKSSWPECQHCAVHRSVRFEPIQNPDCHKQNCKPRCRVSWHGFVPERIDIMGVSENLENGAKVVTDINSRLLDLVSRHNKTSRGKWQGIPLSQVVFNNTLARRQSPSVSRVVTDARVQGNLGWRSQGHFWPWLAGWINILGFRCIGDSIRGDPGMRLLRQLSIWGVCSVYLILTGPW